MTLAILAALPILLTEYGFRSRAGIVEGFTANWQPRRTLVRLAYWVLVLIAIGMRPQGFLTVGLGIALTELGAVVLRRRVRIDMEKGRPHGHPATHLIPFVIGVLSLVLSMLIGQSNEPQFFGGPIQFGSLAALIIFSVVTVWGWGTMVTVSIVDLVRPGQVREDSAGVGAGEVIGVLERLAALVLVANGAFSAVGFVIAAKAAARFPLFKEKAFAEYFLIGTLTSVGLALLLGLLILAEV